jgi:hypothetical protein
MANLIQSIGYSLGKVHTGLIAYLCDLYRNGDVAPLTSLFKSLGITIPQSPVAKREWQSIDLAIFDGDATSPSILIEMKVDDHDHPTKKWIGANQETGPQTDIYARAFPDCNDYLYITLGLGDYYRAPYGKRFRWVRLNEFAQALKQIKVAGSIIEDWKNAVHTEGRLHECVRRNDRSCLAEYRTGAWNICFLGQLKEAFEETSRFTDVDATCYMCGTGPDTILNFGWSKHPIYLEVNYSGRLSLKASLAEFADDTSRQSVIAEAITHLGDTCPAGTYQLVTHNRRGNSKTVAWFDIGLSNTNGYIGFASHLDFTIRRLHEVLGCFYETMSRTCSDLPLMTSIP